MVGAVALANPAAGGASAPLPAASAPAWSPSHFARVDVAPTRTSIYIGTVSMTMPTLERRDGRYETTYVAKVFPYFFYNEQGTLTIDLAETELRRLAAGESVEFSGRARNTAGEARRIEGKATPTDARSGRIKVRVFVSPRVELIFNTTYRFPASPPAPAVVPPSPDPARPASAASPAPVARP